MTFASSASADASGVPIPKPAERGCPESGRLLSRARSQPPDTRANLPRMNTPLSIVHVQIRVKPEAVEAFLAATLDNARASVREPGIARFDVIQSQDDRTRFVLVEVYKTSDAPDAHKRTAHYATWRDRVADMMAEPRTSTKYTNCFPDSQDW